MTATTTATVASRIGTFALLVEGPMARIFEAEVEGTDLTIKVRHELVLKGWTWEVFSTAGFTTLIHASGRADTHGAAVTAATEAVAQVIGR